MNSKPTRSTIGLSNIKIDKLQYNKPPRSQISTNMLDANASTQLPHNEAQFIEEKVNEDVRTMGGHVLNDQLINSVLTAEFYKGKNTNV
jgi:hypothetical protein